jgi:hypothetical protein
MGLSGDENGGKLGGKRIAGEELGSSMSRKSTKQSLLELKIGLIRA